jgi:hypothetical protein
MNLLINIRILSLLLALPTQVATLLGEITFIRTYSRVKEDGTKERWHEVCKRVIEGMYSVQKNHAKENRLPWNDNKAQKVSPRSI